MADTVNEEEHTEIVDKRAAARMDASKTDDNAAAGTKPAEQQQEQPQQQEEETTANSNAELAAERDKAETYYKNWQRSAADFINFKRRVEQERGESQRFAQAALVINILPVFDDLDRAVATVDANLAGLNWVQGINAIHRKFALMLEAMGVREIQAAGESFDPSRHEAVGNAEGDEGKVLHVVQKGYSLNDKVIRPAMVIVGSGKG